MTFDWNVPIGTVILLGIQMIGLAIALAKIFTSVQNTITAKFAHIELVLNTFREGDLRELKGSVTRLETGQDEWTKALRERTHELASTTTNLLLRVDRLERPERYIGRRKDDERHGEDA